MRGLYALYKKISHLTIISTLIFYISDRISGLWNKNRRYVCKTIKKGSYTNEKRIQSKENIKIAYVCDEMTYKSFQDLTRSVFVTPWNWYDVFENEKPDIFFCESAWSGIQEYKDCWRGRIYKSDKVKYNNRKVLFNIVEYCNENKIKTVFWNKEDPTFFGNTEHNFIDTALHFDYIFTTAEECIEKYKQLGAKNVFVLPFGFSPKLFNPMNSMEKENRAVFAGSWYPEFEERCNQMRKIFEEVLKNGIGLRIYDRNAGIKETVNVFPKEYQDFIYGKIPFEELGIEIKKSQYAINVNTVVNSGTMFARRVYEMMACNVCIISNESLGLKKQFPDKVWFVGEPFDDTRITEICRENVQEVLAKHTNYCRLESIIENIHYSSEKHKVFVAIITNELKVSREDENVVISYYKEKNNIIKDTAYVIFKNKIDFSPEQIYQMLVHYQYLEPNVAIKFSDIDRYRIVKTLEYNDVLLPISELNNIKQNKMIRVYGI